MQVNNNQSVMDKLSSWMGSKAAPTQQSNNFREQFLKLRNAGQGDLRQGLAGQNSLLSNASHEIRPSLLGSVTDKNALSHQFTQIGEGIGLGLLAAFAGVNGAGPQFGTTGDKKSAAATNSAVGASKAKSNAGSTELTSMNTKNLTFGVKSDKPQGANNQAQGANPTPPPAANATQDEANNNAANNAQQNTENANNTQAANNAQTANAPAKSEGSGSWNPFSNFFKDLFGNGDKAAAPANATVENPQNGTDTTA